MWDLPGPGLKPVFPELAGGFLTTVPPGMSLEFEFYMGEIIPSVTVVSFFFFFFLGCAMQIVGP